MPKSKTIKSIVKRVKKQQRHFWILKRLKELGKFNRYLGSREMKIFLVDKRLIVASVF